MSDQSQQLPEGAPNDPLTDHAYDGIQEYDNPTPGWWTWLFIGSFVFSVFYFGFTILVGDELGPRGFYARSKSHWDNKLGVYELNPESIKAYATNSEVLAKGANIFASKCASCHGPQGEGATGPNMTDDHYIYVAGIGDMIDVVVNGRKNNTMPAQKGQLSDSEIALVTAYVTSLRGKNLPGKAAEGEVRPAF